MNLVLIETSGNQRYIFATNKLRENVGASELTYRVGTQFVLEAVQEETKKPIYEDDDLDGRKMRANLLNPALNPPIETGGTIEVITATSGKALVLVKDRPTAEKIVRTVTERALRRMPGLTVHGAISEVKVNLSDIHDAVVTVHKYLEEVRYNMPTNEQRFLRLPFVAPCETSGLPAGEVVFLSEDERKENKSHKFSKVSWAKREVLKRDKSKDERDDEGKPSRIVALIQDLFDLKLYENLELLEKDFKDFSWLAVIHADGNGLAGC